MHRLQKKQKKTNYYHYFDQEKKNQLFKFIAVFFLFLFDLYSGCVVIPNHR